MPSKNITPDTRIYATVFYFDHSLQYISTVFVNILATPLSFLTFYLILTQSKYEKFCFKFCLFAAQFSFYMSQMQLGVFGGMVTLHPFPAVYCQGILKNYFSSFTLFMIWAFLFCSISYFTHLIQLIRLQIVARPGKFFDCKQSTYLTSYVILAIFVYVPVPGLMFLSYSTLEEMEEFVRTKYPNNLKVLEHPGLHVFTDSFNTDLANFVMTVTVILSSSLLIAIYIFIHMETRVDSHNISSKTIKERLIIIHNLIVQSVFMSGFITTALCLIIKTFFNDPSVDSRLSNTIAYSCLCGASIPNQILMISRNTSYKNFVLRRKKSSQVIPDISHHYLQQQQQIS